MNLDRMRYLHNPSRPVSVTRLHLEDGSTVTVWIKGNGWGIISDSADVWRSNKVGVFYDNLPSILAEYRIASNVSREQLRRVHHLWMALGSHCIAARIIR